MSVSTESVVNNKNNSKKVFSGKKFNCPNFFEKGRTVSLTFD